MYYSYIYTTISQLTCVLETRYDGSPISSKTVPKLLGVSCIFQNTEILESGRLHYAQATAPTATVLMLISTLI
jgi:hypothetical protein